MNVHELYHIDDMKVTPVELWLNDSLQLSPQQVVRQAHLHRFPLPVAEHQHFLLQPWAAPLGNSRLSLFGSPPKVIRVYPSRADVAKHWMKTSTFLVQCIWTNTFHVDIIVPQALTHPHIEYHRTCIPESTLGLTQNPGTRGKL